MIQKLVSLLSDNGGSMLFSTFVNEARQQGLRPELWVRAKRGGELHTTIDDAGNVVIHAGAHPNKAGGNS